jgi:hypothetical protein
MIKNQLLEKRIAQLIAQTHAVSVESVIEDIQQFGIEMTIQKLEEFDQNKPNFA